MNDKINYARASFTEKLINLNHTSGKDFITKLRYSEPDITLEEIWQDLYNFESATMTSDIERKIVFESREILRHEYKTKEMIKNL